MVFRRPGPQPDPFAGRGGLPPQRIDQFTAAMSRAGVGPAPQQAIFIGRYVVIFGGAGGLFVYNGPPALGNPPIFAVVAPGVTTDPYGNPVKAVMNAGNISGAHFGLDNNGNAYLADSTGATRIYMSPSAQVLNFYTAGTASLLMSLAGTAGIDPFTAQAYPEGLAIYGTSSQQISVQLASGIPRMQYATGRTEEFVPAYVQAQVDNTGAPNEVLNLFVGGPIVATYTDNVFMNLQSSTEDGTGTAVGTINYLDRSAVDHDLLVWGAGGIIAGNILDGQEYDIQRRTLIAQGQNVSSSSNVNIAGLGASVAAQTYRFSAKIMLECISAATPVIEFSGPALNSLELDWRMEAVINSNSSPGDSFTFRTLSTLGGITGAAMATTGLWTVYIDGQITPSVAGTLQMITRTGGSGNFDILAGSYFDLMPVTV